MNHGRSFSHEISAEWSDSWEIFSNGCQLFRFNGKGNFCAILDSSGSHVSLWDFSVTPQYANRVIMPANVRLQRAANLEWSDKNDQLAISFIPKGKLPFKISFQYHSDVVIASINRCEVESVFRLSSTCAISTCFHLNYTSFLSQTTFHRI